MELRQLATLCSIVESGSITAAARALGYAQSTVTAQLQTLEFSAGSPLFTRDGKRLNLTAAGHEVYERARMVVREVDDIRGALAELKDGVAGDVGLGAIESAADTRVPGALAGFLKVRPRVRVRFETGGTSVLARRVAAGELDIAVCAMPPADLGLRFESLYVERLALLVGSASPLFDRTSVRLGDIGGERILLTQATCSYNATIRDAAARAGLMLDVALESANVATLKRAVQLGMGAAVLPFAEMESVPPGTKVVCIENGQLRLAIGLVRTKSPLSTAAQALANALAGALRG